MRGVRKVRGGRGQGKESGKESGKEGGERS